MENINLKLNVINMEACEKTIARLYKTEKEYFDTLSEKIQVNNELEYGKIKLIVEEGFELMMDLKM